MYNILDISKDEEDAIRNCHESLVSSRILHESSSSDGLVNLIKREIRQSSIYTSFSDEETRNTIFILMLQKVWFKSLRISLLQEKYSNVPSGSFSAVMVKLIRCIDNLIDSIVFAKENSMSIVSGILARNILEVSWLASIFAYNPEKSLLFTDTTIDEYTRWKMNFSPSLLKKSINDISTAILNEIPDYIEYLKKFNLDKYKEYSTYAHLSWESLLDETKEPSRDVCISLWYAILIIEFTMVRKHNMKVDISPESIASIVSYKVIMSVIPGYLEEYKWN